MNADTAFRDFVDRQQRLRAADEAIDWAQERDDWLQSLKHLYDVIASHLAEYIESGAILLRTSTIEVNEENIGVYSATRLAILIGSQEIILTPIGTLLIGSKGRVDVNGSAGDSRLVLINKDIHLPRQMFRVIASPEHLGSEPSLSASTGDVGLEWKIVSRPPAIHFTELNKETLFEMLMEVSNG